MICIDMYVLYLCVFLVKHLKKHKGLHVKRKKAKLNPD